MIVKKLKELYCVDTISQDKGWKKVHDAVTELGDEVLIDFSGIHVVDPWQCAEFKQLLKDDKVFMRFTNCEAIVNRIKMMCIIEGLNENRIENVYIELPKEKTAEEKKVENYGNELITMFEISDDNVATFDVSKKYSQMYSTNTLNYLDYAIREIHQVQCVDKFIIKMGRTPVLENVLEMLAKLIIEYKSMGIDVKADIEDEEAYKSMGLFIHLATNDKYDSNERYRAIKNTLKANTPGILIKYRKSKALDSFGRHGKGEVVSSRIAVFRGIKNGNNGPIFMVETFNNDTFYTPQHWMVEHDNEVPSKLQSENVEITMEEIGLCDLFLGTQYHFLMPIQQNESENQVVIKDIDDDGRNIKQTCSIPERMQIVFDSWNIKYDKESLEESIEKTKEYLKNKKVGQAS